MRKILALMIAALLLVMALGGCMNKGATPYDGTNGEAENTNDLKPTKYETVNDLQGVTMTIKEGTVSPNGWY